MNKPLLVIKASERLSRKQIDAITAAAKPVAESLGAECLVSDEGLDIGVHQDLAPLVAAVNEQTAMLAELLALARKSEERQARADRAHQAIQDAQARSAAAMALGGGSIAAALRGRK